MISVFSSFFCACYVINNVLLLAAVISEEECNRYCDYGSVHDIYHLVLIIIVYIFHALSYCTFYDILYCVRPISDAVFNYI